VLARDHDALIFNRSAISNVIADFRAHPVIDKPHFCRATARSEFRVYAVWAGGPGRLKAELQTKIFPVL
jgi:hypothetical protein